VRRVLLLGAAVLLLPGCGAGSKRTDAPRTTAAKQAQHVLRSPSTSRLVSVLRLAPVRSRVLPGYLLVADRNNDRVILLAPDRRIVWQRTGFKQPDDAFFTPGYGGVITNEEFDDTLTQVSLRSKRLVWRYGHAGIPGRAKGYLDAPDDAYRLANGVTTVADIRNCRIVELRHDRTVLRVLGGSCVHDPPRGFASPNGDTPLPDGGILVTEIGGWVDRLDRSGRVLWSVRTPFSYPSDAQLLPNGRILVCAFHDPGRVIEMTRSGHVTWSFGASAGRDRLDRPSLAMGLPNGLVAINDDWRHRVIVVDPRTNHIVWQYGHADVASRARGYLDKPDGMDFLPASSSARSASVLRPSADARTGSPKSTKPPVLSVTRIGSLPEAISRLSAAVLPGGRILVLGGLVAGRSSSVILAGPPGGLHRIGSLPAPTHDAAAVAVGPEAVELIGGGDSVSRPSVARVDAVTGTARRLPPLDEPLSDLGAAVIRGCTYLVGGFTGTRLASAILRLGPRDRISVVARLPAGVRYAGVAALGDAIFVAGGITAVGPSNAVYRVDIADHRVSRIATLRRSVTHAPLVASAGALWLVGGDGSSAVWRIDPGSGRVSLAARLPKPLANAAAVTLPDRRIVVVGGDASAAVFALVPGTRARSR
jgi:hypothetical protein